MEAVLFPELERKSVKRCCKCGKYKSLSEFNIHNDSLDTRRQPYCRACQHRYYEEHKDESGIKLRTLQEQVEYNRLLGKYRMYMAALFEYQDKYGEVESRLKGELPL